jgi:hypothetical protein
MAGDMLDALRHSLLSSNIAKGAGQSPALFHHTA